MQRLPSKTSVPRLVVTSDLHYESKGTLTSPEEIEHLVDRIQKDSPDLVLLAGDIGHRLSNFEACLAAFQRLSVPLAVLAGNHDIWRDDERGEGSSALWQTLLPEATRRHGAFWLEDTSLQIGGIAIVGSLAWYDYSAIDPSMAHLSAETVALHKRFVNNDAHWIDALWTDIDFANTLKAGLLERLKAASDDPSVETILLVTHVPVVEEHMIRKPDEPDWGVSNAYFGNLSLGRACLAFPKVTGLVSGHAHLDIRTYAPRPPLPDVAAYLLGSDYGDPTHLLLRWDRDGQTWLASSPG